jgi:hypothetical protein
MLTVSFSISRARGNEMVAANVTGTGFRPGQEMVLTACWNRAVHPTYAWYHQIAHVHANRYGTLPAPTVVPTFVMYVPSGRSRSWDVRVVAADARTGQRLAAVARGPSAGSVAHAGAVGQRGIHVSTRLTCFHGLSTPSNWTPAGAGYLARVAIRSTPPTCSPKSLLPVATASWTSW